MTTALDDTTVLSDEGTEDEGSDSHKLDQNVDGWAGSVLEGVTDGITANSILVSVRLLLYFNRCDNLKAAILVLLTLSSVGSVVSFVEVSGFDVLLAVVPSATGVGGGEGNLNTGGDNTCEHTRDEFVTKEVTEDKRGKDDNATWGDHLSEGSTS